jgi:glutathione S-transferase
MPFEYISTQNAIEANGLRMVVVSNVPSPWGEAAKGILHMKSIPWKAVRLVYDSDTFDRWAKEQTAPIVFYENEEQRSGWREILDLAERLAPQPTLIAKDADAMFALCHDLFGENGLAWARRLQLIEAGLNGEGGFLESVSNYLGAKYGYTPALGAAASTRVHALLGELAEQLKAQNALGSPYYFGDRASAADINSAAVMAMFGPLPEPECVMKPATRAAFETLDGETNAALDPILLAHRDHMYAAHLELPLSL